MEMDEQEDLPKDMLEQVGRGGVEVVVLLQACMVGDTLLPIPQTMVVHPADGSCW